MSKLGSLERAGAALHTSEGIGAIPSATHPGASEFFRKHGLRRAALALAILAVAVLSDPLARTDCRAELAPADTRSLMALCGAEAVTIDRKAREFKTPDQIEWKSRPGSASQSATLFGDPSKPGL